MVNTTRLPAGHPAPVFVESGMDSPRLICVGTDFSPCSAFAVAEAARIAAATGSVLVPVHVIDLDVLSRIEHSLPSVRPGLRDELTQDAMAAWRHLASTLSPSPSADLRVEFAGRVEGLVGVCREVGAALLVLGASGDSAPDLGVGTVATGCVGGALCDVLLVRENEPGPFRRVLVGVDYSETSVEALRKAAQVAARDGAELHVLHVYRGPASLFPFLTGVITQWAEAVSGLEDQEAGRLKEFVDGVLGSGETGSGVTDSFPVLRTIESNLHGRTIAQAAQEIGADLVVVGTRGATNLRDMVLGSTAERVLRDTRSAILAVKPRA